MYTKLNQKSELIMQTRRGGAGRGTNVRALTKMRRDANLQMNDPDASRAGQHVRTVSACCDVILLYRGRG